MSNNTKKNNVVANETEIENVNANVTVDKYGEVIEESNATVTETVEETETQEQGLFVERIQREDPSNPRRIWNDYRVTYPMKNGSMIVAKLRPLDKEGGAGYAILNEMFSNGSVKLSVITTKTTDMATGKRVVRTHYEAVGVDSDGDTIAYRVTCIQPSDTSNLNRILEKLKKKAQNNT
ncbi:MAG: hypothetical protein FWD49_05245 [Firmicutes bacterium]|nr:hypothetical protein [Bacillota bacterium]